MQTCSGCCQCLLSQGELACDASPCDAVVSQSTTRRKLFCCVGSSRAAAALQNGEAFFPDLLAAIRGPPHAPAHVQADSMRVHASAPEREIRADRAAHAPSPNHGHEHVAGAPHLAPSQQPAHHHRNDEPRAAPNLAPAPAQSGHPEHSAAHAPAHAPSQHHDHLAPAHAPSHVEHHARAPVSGDPHRTGETKSPAHSDSHAEEHHGAPSHAPAHAPELHEHKARAPSSHHVDAKHSSHAEHGHHAPSQAPQEAPAAHRVEADRDPGHPPPPPPGGLISVDPLISPLHVCMNIAVVLLSGDLLIGRCCSLFESCALNASSMQIRKEGRVLRTYLHACRRAQEGC